VNDDVIKMVLRTTRGVATSGLIGILHGALDEAQVPIPPIMHPLLNYAPTVITTVYAQCFDPDPRYGPEPGAVDYAAFSVLIGTTTLATTGIGYVVGKLGARTIRIFF